MVKTILLLISFVLFPIVIIEGYKRWSWVQKVGTVVLAYAVGIIIALTGIAPTAQEAGGELFHSVRSIIMSIAVPLAIPLMLFNCDFKLWTKALPKTIWSLVGGISAVLIAVISGYFIFRSHGIPQFDKVAAMMTGIYTGGTMNFNALGAALDVDETTMAIVLAFEMVLTTPYIFFILAGGYKVFRKVLPYADPEITSAKKIKIKARDTEIATADIENYRGMFERNNFLGMLKGVGLSVVFLVLGAGLALLLTGKLNELVIILTITTLSIIASFFKPVRELPKTFEAGMFFILIFSVIVASLFDIHSVNGGSLWIGLFVGYIIIVACVLHLLFCKLVKVDGDLFCVSQIALLCSPPFVPPVVGAMKNKKVLISGIVIGLVGYAIGTYLGVIIAWILP